MMRRRSWLLSVLLLLSFCGFMGGVVASAQTIEFVDASGASASSQLEKGRARVRIADPGLNFYQSAPDMTAVTFTSAATGDQEQLWFRETGPNTGVFTGGIDLTAGPGASLDGVLATQTGPPPSSTLDTVEAKYQRSGGGFQTVTATVIPSVTALIDEAGNEPASVAVYHKVHVRVEDHNADSPLEAGTVTVQLTTIRRHTSSKGLSGWEAALLLSMGSSSRPAWQGRR